ncbi:isocitrate lyase/phosphoenolpyruvate mutase family protein [Streptomyces sp. SP17BM10]|uniref:isocitrate lyase/PEP mutase family protein n=1 Tax=Streptomyces sp. SP17BM10 TaxID=3002530 RepID=UPI002E75F3DD|nr:isocitrate lyase/phosphoenolpyruvate mutase family protein [Streptomyces sp. SP17BM10]MEE1788271.1 isocitrate lyase/phosphoenolpyruvate mutase family protein [Streptomyces sp. SP17BM10]
MTSTADAAAFRELHHRPGEPLVLPNAWDHASAAALAAAGFPAIATTSLGVSAAAGLPDGTGGTRAAMLRLARRFGHGRFLFTVDIENGYGDDPAEVADLAAELADTGAVGLNLEDGRADGGLTAPHVHAAKIAAIKAAAPLLFVNARTDTHWQREPDLADTLSRLAAYQDAGADGVFVPGLTDPAAIAEVVAAIPLPLNLLAPTGGPSLKTLADLGVRRVSLGGLLFRIALGAAVDAAVALRTDGILPAVPNVPSYAAVQALAE